MEVFSHQVPGGMMSNLVSQLEVQKASDRLPDVLAEIPKVRAEVGYPPLVTPLSQIVGTQAVINVLTGKRWAVVPQEMKDYIKGLYGKAPGPDGHGDRRQGARRRASRSPPDVRPGSLVDDARTTRSAAEIGDLAQSEEDVLMYALFPNEARTYLTLHQEGAEKAVFLMSEEINTVKEDESVDVNQIRELIKIVEASDVTEVVVEEGGTKVVVRKGGVASPPPRRPPRRRAAPRPRRRQRRGRAPAAGERPAHGRRSSRRWSARSTRSPSPGADAVRDGRATRSPRVSTLCILEAMKLMNEITAEEAGVIREVAVDERRRRSSTAPCSSTTSRC